MSRTFAPTGFILSFLAPISGLLAGCGPSDTERPEIELVAISGEGGVFLTSSEPPPEGASLVREGDDTELAFESAGTVDGDGTVESCYELRDEQGVLAQARATAVELHWSASPTPLVMTAGEVAELELGLEPSLPSWAADGMQWGLRRRGLASDEEHWLDPSCLAGTELEASCWLDEPIDEPWSEHRLTLPAYRPPVEDTQSERLGLFLVLEDGAGGQVLAGGELDLVFLAHSLAWGDLHAHTNLSMDGCEDRDLGCHPRGDSPGEDFFDKARDAGLDFAAITDHAEYDVLTEGDEPVIDIWDATLELVEEAEGQEGFVPLLGYEWTHRVKGNEVLDEGEDPDDHPDLFVAGHRTVILAASSACRAYRLASRTPGQAYVKAGTEIVYDFDEEHRDATDVGALVEGLDQAGIECEPVDWLSWFHHPAMVGPNPVAWSLDHNLEQLDRESLVEIASEHGSSECRDPLQEGCEFRPPYNEDRDNHVAWGSIQEALDLGYRLGFVGGTDAHDGRPGSLDDGPSAVAERQEDGVPPEQIEPYGLPYAGALTGALVLGELERESLWQALKERRSLASTARLDGAVMVALGSDGTPYLPGAELPAEAFPLHLMVRLEPSDTASVERVELVEPHDGAVLGSAEGSTLELWLDDPGGAAIYVRARLDYDGEEHRLWFSPLFLSATD